MKLPFKPQSVLHRHGGRIVEVNAMKHQANRPRDGRSLDGWWFVGDVEWSDGTSSKNHPIEPPMLCYEDEAGRKEVAQLSEAMMDYLREHGDWFHSKPHEGWYARRKERSAA